ncbi:hypothetical protein Tco_0758436 [Tanacetum coccineum]
MVMNSILLTVPHHPYPISHWKLYGNRGRSRITAVSEVSDVVFVPGDPDITWQIVVGTIGFGLLEFVAGVTPFVVAGIEFSKRIVS